MAMEAVASMEDDKFFADLNRQISLLIDDDDELGGPVSLCPSLSLHVLHDFPYSIHQPNPTQFVSHQQNRARETSKGTGVFIPRCSPPPRRKNKQAKHGNSFTTKSHTRQIAYPRSGVPHIPYNDTNSAYRSNNKY